MNKKTVGVGLLGWGVGSVIHRFLGAVEAWRLVNAELGVAPRFTDLLIVSFSFHADPSFVTTLLIGWPSWVFPLAAGLLVLAIDRTASREIAAGGRSRSVTLTAQPLLYAALAVECVIVGIFTFMLLGR